MPEDSKRPGPEIVRKLRSILRADPLPAAGSTFHKYEILEEIGRGALGVVYRARQRDLDRVVALKVLRNTGDEEARRAFAREARLAADLDHPHIAKIYEVGEERGLPYIAMQLIDGVTLSSARESMGTKERTACVRHAAEALAYAHERHVVHRDVKPSNIMVDRRGSATVTDFGLAKRLAGGAESLTAADVVRGTPVFMSPEQARGQSRLVDARSDVYSLGATLYAVLLGRPPFERREGEDVVALLHRVAGEDPPPPRKLDASIPGDLEAIVLTAMEKERDRRYVGAAELADDLRRFEQGEPVRARRPGLPYRLRKRIAKHRGAVGIAGVSFLIALVFAAYLLQTRLIRGREKAWALRDAERAESQGAWESALASYQHALALDSKDDRVRRKAADMEERAKSLRLESARMAAEVTYREAARDLYHIRMRSYVPDWRLTDADFLDFERLAEICEVRLRETGDSGAGWWAVGQARYLLGNWSQAEAAYRRGLGAEPEHGRCTLDLARLLIETALLEFAGAPEDPMTNPSLTEETQEALSLLEQGLQSGKFPEIETDLARGYLQLLRKEDIRDYGTRMFQKWKGREFAEEFLLIRGMNHLRALREDATAVLQTRPRFYQAFFWRGAARFDLGDRQGALDDFTRALEIHPRLAAAYRVRGACRYHMSDWRAARADLDRSLEIDPVHSWPRRIRALARLALHDLPGAREDCDRAIAENPKSALNFATRGLVRRKLGDQAGAIEDYTRSLELNPRVAATWFNRGNARVAGGDPKGALEDYAKAIEVQPGHAAAHTNREGARKELGDIPGALEDYAKALEINPRLVEAYVARGLLRMSLHEHASAIQDYTKAIELTSEKDAGPFYRRGEARLASNDPDGAIEDFTRALRLQPRGSDIYLNRAVILERKARLNPEEAVPLLRAAADDLQKALEGAPETWANRDKATALLEKVRAAQHGLK